VLEITVFMPVFLTLGVFLFPCVIFEKMLSNERACTTTTNFKRWLLCTWDLVLPSAEHQWEVLSTPSFHSKQ